MYAGMLNDLAETENYVHELSQGRCQSGFDHALRRMIEDTLRGR